MRALFSQAQHVEIGRELLVIVGPTSPAGPLHLRVDPLPDTAVHAEARLADGRLHVGTDEVDLRAARPWTPPPIDGPARPVPLPGAARSALAGEADLLIALAALLERGDVEAAAGLLGGLGPGLTPAGDDLLAGIALTLHAFGFSEPRLRAMVETVRTTDLARAYLRWAARGQCIAPAHDLLRAVAGGDDAGVARAERELCSHGASSGADLLLGIDLALRHGPLGDSRGAPYRSSRRTPARTLPGGRVTWRVRTGAAPTRPP